MDDRISSKKSPAIECRCHLCGRAYLCEGSINEIEGAIKDPNWMPDGWVHVVTPKDMFYCEDCVRKFKITLSRSQAGLESAYSILNGGRAPRGGDATMMDKRPGVSLICNRCKVRTLVECGIEQMKQFMADPMWKPGYWEIHNDELGVPRYYCDVCCSNKNLVHNNRIKPKTIIIPMNWRK